MVASFGITHSAGDLYGFLLKHSPLYGPSRSQRDLAFNFADVPRHGAAPRPGSRASSTFTVSLSSATEFGGFIAGLSRLRSAVISLMASLTHRPT